MIHLAFGFIVVVVALYLLLVVGQLVICAIWLVWRLWVDLWRYDLLIWLCKGPRKRTVVIIIAVWLSLAGFAALWQFATGR